MRAAADVENQLISCSQGRAAAVTLEQLAEQLHAALDELPGPYRFLLNILYICDAPPPVNIQVGNGGKEIK